MLQKKALFCLGKCLVGTASLAGGIFGFIISITMFIWAVMDILKLLKGF